MKVKIYTTETCPFCQQAKDFLKENNIEFEDIDVRKNDEDAEEMIRKTGQRLVPVIEVDDKVILGFDKEELKKALNIE